MITLPEYFYELNTFSIILRLILAVLLGGIIGIERGASGHPAGFRTHILVCVGAALAMLTNQYICDFFEGVHDPARLGAQVITGVGFLGVGTILVTGGHKIKGLTTAAGLWASACLGLAVGIGFYNGAIIAAIVIFISLALLPKLENAIIRKSRTMEIYIELNDIKSLKAFMQFLKAKDIDILERTLSKAPAITDSCVPLIMLIKNPHRAEHKLLIDYINQLDYVCLIEEI